MTDHTRKDLANAGLKDKMDDLLKEIDREEIQLRTGVVDEIAARSKTIDVPRIYDEKCQLSCSTIGLVSGKKMSFNFTEIANMIRETKLGKSTDLSPMKSIGGETSLQEMKNFSL